MNSLIECLTAILESVNLNLVGRTFMYPTHKITLHLELNMWVSMQQSQPHTLALMSSVPFKQNLLLTNGLGDFQKSLETSLPICP